ncbi:hypothetical protein AYO44_05520 [Planctomycetaceae bacterium SCGC AG-212-F19]|nr:hypothetical protein AYO44_05520 [Planctomycetaceae bacterium SCGC AG-212-F19]
MRLELANGQRIPNPDDQTVARALRSVGEGEEYAILVHDDTGEQHFIQVAKGSAGFVVEYREGERQYRSTPLPQDTVIKTFQAYRKQDKSWKEGVAWTDITDEVVNKSGCRGKAGVLLGLIFVALGPGYGLLLA